MSSSVNLWLLLHNFKSHMLDYRAKTTEKVINCPNTYELHCVSFWNVQTLHLSLNLCHYLTDLTGEYVWRGGCEFSVLVFWVRRPLKVTKLPGIRSGFRLPSYRSACPSHAWVCVGAGFASQSFRGSVKSDTTEQVVPLSRCTRQWPDLVLNVAAKL